MATNNSTKIGFFEALRLCILVTVDPESFVEEQLKDDKRTKDLPHLPQIPTPFLIRNAFWSAFGLVIASAIAGMMIGQGYSWFVGSVSTNAIRNMQIFGALILLWGTLFVRGWDIQSYGGTKLAERVNRWIFRGLYCIGTATIVLSFSLRTP